MDGFQGGRQNRSVFDVKRVPGVSVVAPHPKRSLVATQQSC
jgi:hypothetical protein